MKIVLATTNAHKVKEILKIWGETPFQVLTLNDVDPIRPIQEDGATFAENALIKARAVAAHTGLTSVSDDSGLVVTGLDGRPGIYSARYAGEGADDWENLEKVRAELNALRATPEQRRAYFFCAAAAVFPDGRERVTEGRIDGEILEAPRGEKGFGYDPLFFVPALGKTLAEVPVEEKNKISHRAQAFSKMREVLLFFHQKR